MEEIIVYTIVAAAAIALVFKIRKGIKEKGKCGGCNGCNGCSKYNGCNGYSRRNKYIEKTKLLSTPTNIKLNKSTICVLRGEFMHGCPRSFRKIPSASFAKHRARVKLF